MISDALPGLVLTFHCEPELLNQKLAFNRLVVAAADLLMTLSSAIIVSFPAL